MSATIPPIALKTSWKHINQTRFIALGVCCDSSVGKPPGVEGFSGTPSGICCKDTISPKYYVAMTYFLWKPTRKARTFEGAGHINRRSKVTRRPPVFIFWCRVFRSDSDTRWYLSWRCSSAISGVFRPGSAMPCVRSGLSGKSASGQTMTWFGTWIAQPDPRQSPCWWLIHRTRWKFLLSLTSEDT